MDAGQLLVFAMLYGFAYVTESNKHYGKLIVLWFNSVITGGMAFVTWMSILRGRPFLLEVVQSQMLPTLYNKLCSRQFFITEITAMAGFWVKILLLMTAVVSIQPLLVTVYLGGDAEKNAGGRMTSLGHLLSAGQCVILFYGLHKTYKWTARPDVLKRRVREVKKHGLDANMLDAYDFSVNFVTVEPAAHRIQSLTEAHDLDNAGHVLFQAFQSDTDFIGWIEDAATRLELFKANLPSVACFNLVLGSFETSTGGEGSTPGGVSSDRRRPRCVMACIPVLSQSKEEIEVFHTMEAFAEHGLEKVPEEFLIPTDDMYDLMQLKKKTEHGLAAHPYIYIAWFGADPKYKGRGYGRSLLRHIVGVAESRKLPLVLETTNAFNRMHYERYGFEVLDRVSAKKEYVLMVRRPRGKT
jgi:GNAT superfamily N-acetyltransferase